MLRDRLTQVELDQLALDLTLSRSRDRLKAGQPPGPEASIFKLYGTELNQRRRELMVAIARARRASAGRARASATTSSR